MKIAAENKARLFPLGPDGTTTTGDPIIVQFNPEKYSTSWDMAWSEVGQSLQWTKTTAGNLMLTLNFDSYEQQVDVTTISGKIRLQLDPGLSQGKTIGCLFQWGKMIYKGVVASIKEDFTLFLPDGTPVRSVIVLTLKPWPEEIQG